MKNKDWNVDGCEKCIVTGPCETIYVDGFFRCIKCKRDLSGERAWVSGKKGTKILNVKQEKKISKKIDELVKYELGRFNSKYEYLFASYNEEKTLDGILFFMSDVMREAYEQGKNDGIDLAAQ